MERNRHNANASETPVSLSVGTQGASLNKVYTLINSDGSVSFTTYTAGGGQDRNGTSPAGIFTINQFRFLRFAFDGDGVLETDKIRIFVDEVQQPLTMTGTAVANSITRLATVTGNVLMGCFSTSNFAQALRGDIGPDIFFMDDNVTPLFGQTLMNLRRVA